jgi:O-methyltransferase
MKNTLRRYEKKLRTLRRILRSYVLFRHFGSVRSARQKYLQLMLNCLVGSIYDDPPLKSMGNGEFNAELREYGWDWPSKAHSMIGKKRMENIRYLVENILFNGVPGDLIETGVWRGGACIYMRAILDIYGVRNRKVWLADSFEGLPPPDPTNYPADADDNFHTYTDLAVSIDVVRNNFAKYNLLDDKVVFLKGWFKDTLPSSATGPLALLRLDGDMYESTMDALRNLYDRLSVRGFIIIDDYRVVEGCRSAVDDFRSSRNINDAIIEIDGVGVYWQKTIY